MNISQFIRIRQSPRQRGWELDIYQAVEFRMGGDLPAECKEGLSDKELVEIWVKGLYFAPAERIRREMATLAGNYVYSLIVPP